MDNSLEVLHGSIAEVKRKYEILTDLIKEYNDKTHGNQSHIFHNNELSIVVYYEVAEGRLNEFKQKFQNNH